MTKSEFIAWLQEMPGEPIVKAWDPEQDDWLPVSGATYDEGEILRYTDMDEDEAMETAWEILWRSAVFGVGFSAWMSLIDLVLEGLTWHWRLLTWRRHGPPPPRSG